MTTYSYTIALPLWALILCILLVIFGFWNLFSIFYYTGKMDGLKAGHQLCLDMYSASVARIAELHFTAENEPEEEEEEIQRP